MHLDDFGTWLFNFIYNFAQCHTNDEGTSTAPGCDEIVGEPVKQGIS